MTSRLICDTKMPTRLKETCDKMIVQPTTLYDTMLENYKWACAHTSRRDVYAKIVLWQDLLGKIRNERINEYWWIEPIEDKICGKTNNVTVVLWGITPLPMRRCLDFQFVAGMEMEG